MNDIVVLVHCNSSGFNAKYVERRKHTLRQNYNSKLIHTEIKSISDEIIIYDSYIYVLVFLGISKEQSL